VRLNPKWCEKLESAVFEGPRTLERDERDFGAIELFFGGDLKSAGGYFTNHLSVAKIYICI
jgi:hypothetical protein